MVSAGCQLWRAKPLRRGFKAYPIGYFHIDIAEVRTEEGKLHLYVASIAHRSSPSPNCTKRLTGRPRSRFLEALLETVPYELHTILTDNGIQFADLPRNRDSRTARMRVHRFDQICREHGIEHRLTKPNHPWTNGQVERMNRTIKDATVKRYHYGSHEQLRQHLQLFIDAYNHGRRLKTLRGLTPYEYVARIWTEEPSRFKADPYRYSSGLNT